MQKEYITKESRRGMDMLVDKRRAGEASSSNYAFGNPTVKVEISLNSILLILGIAAAIYLSPKLLSIFGLIFFAFIISSAALPVVRKLMEKGVSKGLSIFLVYFLGILLLFGILTLVLVPFISQSQNLLSNLPTIVNDFIIKLSQLKIFGRTLDTQTIEKVLENVVNWLTSVVTFSGSVEGIKSAWGALSSVAGGLLSVITVMLLSVYMVIDHDNFVDIILLRIVDEAKRKRVRQLFFDVEDKLGNWLLGQVTLSLVLGFLTWLLLTIARVPFALPLAVLAGLFESIPNLGPTLSAIPAILFGTIAGGPLSAVIIIVGFAIIHEAENTLLVPRIMSNAVGLKPIVVVIAVAAGFTLIGPFGAILSIPVAVLLEIFYQFYLDLQKLKAKGIV